MWSSGTLNRGRLKTSSELESLYRRPPICTNHQIMATLLFRYPSAPPWCRCHSNANHLVACLQTWIFPPPVHTVVRRIRWWCLSNTFLFRVTCHSCCSRSSTRCGVRCLSLKPWHWRSRNRFHIFSYGTSKYTEKFLTQACSWNSCIRFFRRLLSMVFLILIIQQIHGQTTWPAAT